MKIQKIVIENQMTSGVHMHAPDSAEKKFKSQNISSITMCK